MTFRGLIFFSTLMNHSRFVRLFKRVCVFYVCLLALLLFCFFKTILGPDPIKQTKNCIIFVFIDLPAAPFHG